MTIDQETLLARRLFTRYRCITSEAWGPYVNFDPSFFERINPLLFRLGDFIGKEMPEPGRKRVLHCSSAWHAANTLLWLQFVSAVAPLPQKHVYRGHAKTEWPLQSTRQRLDEVGRRIDDLATVLFIETVRKLIPGITNTISRSGLRGLARHYGLASHLLDFTGDPAVAVWFACNDASVASGKARVLALNTHQFARSGGTFYVPPPIEDRMFAQVALQLDTRALDPAKIEADTYSVTFPIPPKEHPFLLYRDGNLIQPLHAHEWLAALAPHCRECAHRHSMTSRSRRQIKMLVAECADTYKAAPPELRSISQSALLTWIRDFVDWLHWTFMSTDLQCTRDSIDFLAIKTIVADNPFIAQLAMLQTNAMHKQLDIAGFDRLASLIAQGMPLANRVKGLPTPLVAVVNSRVRQQFLDQLRDLKSSTVWP